MKTAAGAKPEYSGSIDVLMKVSRQEGVLALWKGFAPYFFRLGPHTVITFILMEQLNTAYKSYNSPPPLSPLPPPSGKK